MENHQVEVSVIVPNYNYARFLQQRIESILQQTYRRFELILLDDASTDDSVDVLNRYRHNEHVSHLEVNSVNTGSPFAQWKKGIALARGKYIWVAESDDAAEPEFLERAVGVLEQHPQASFCFLGSHCIGEQGEPLPVDHDRWTSKQLCRPRKTGVFEGREYVKYNLYWRNYIYNASGVVFRKQCFERIQDFSCFSMRYSGDWLFWVQMALQGDVVEVYDKLNRFRLHGGSTTKKSFASGEGMKEDMHIVAAIERLLPTLETKRKRLRHGMFYKDIRRLPAADEVKRELYTLLKSSFATSTADYYTERLNRVLGRVFPCLITRDNDRL